jgi:hypothetical protein
MSKNTDEVKFKQKSPVCFIGEREIPPITVTLFQSLAAFKKYIYKWTNARSVAYCLAKMQESNRLP